MNYQPFGSNVLLSKPKIKTKTSKGIIKGDQAVRDEAQEWDGTLAVVAVGDACKWAKVGQQVFLTNGSPITPIPLAHDDVDYLTVDEYTLCGVLNPAQEPAPLADLTTLPAIL